MIHNRKVHSSCLSHEVACMCSRQAEVILDICNFSLQLQVERFGKPTLRRLVESVEDHVGGNNPTMAQRIARKYPGELV